MNVSKVLKALSKMTGGIVALAMVAVLVAGFPRLASAAVNLIPNWSFETAGTGSLPADWIDAGWGSGTIQRVAVNYNDGAWSLEIKPGSHTGYVAATQATPMSIAGGVTYKLRVYAKSLVAQPEAHVRIDYFDANGSSIPASTSQYYHTLSLPVNTPYAGSYEGLFTAPAAARTCRVNLYVKGNGTGTNSVWFDSVVFQGQSDPSVAQGAYPQIAASPLQTGLSPTVLPRIPTTVKTLTLPVTLDGCILTVDDAGNVYTTSGSSVVSFNRDGAIRWQRAVGWVPRDMVLRQDRTLVACGGTQVAAINMDTGAVVWSTALPGGAEARVLNIGPTGLIYVVMSKAWTTSTLVILTPDGTVVSSLAGFNPDAELRGYTDPTPAVYPRFAIDSAGNLYFTAYEDASDGNVRILRSVTSTGQLRWTAVASTNRYASGVALSSDETKVFQAEGQYLKGSGKCYVLLNAYNAATGALIWSKQLAYVTPGSKDRAMWEYSTVWVAPDGIYVGAKCYYDNDGGGDRSYLYAFRVSLDGSTVTRLSDGNGIFPTHGVAYPNGYFADRISGGITLWDAAGNAVYTCTALGTDRGVAVGKDGSLYYGSTATLSIIGSLPAAPAAATGPTTSSTATFVWNPLAEALGYRVYDTSGNLKATVTYHYTSYTETGLTPNTQVVRDIETYNAIGASATRTRITLVTQAAQPTAPTFSSITQTSATVSWTANGNPAGTVYELSRNGAVVYTGQNLSCTDSGLQPGTQYTYQVRAKNQAGQWTSASSASVRTVPPTPPAPSVQSIGGLTWSQTAGRGYVVLTWPAQTGATGYKVWVFDGNTYRAFDVGNTTTWDSRVAKIYPSEATLDSYGDNTQSGDLFNHVNGAEDLRDTPNKLYRKTTGTTYDTANNYWFRLSAYNASGESPLSTTAAQPTLPNRSDSTAPTGSMTVDGGSQYTSALSVTLNVSASDPKVANYTTDTGDDASGVAQMRFSNDNTIWSPWETFAANKSWTLAPGEGTKTVYGQVKDAAGNVSATFSKEIYLFFDSQAPNVSMKINDGSPLTSKTAVTLNLLASDNFSGTPDLQMRFSNDWTNWSSWETYQATKNWTIPSGDGPKVVYCQVKDKAGNVGTAYALVTLSTQPPTVDAAKAASAVGTTGTVYISGNPVSTCFVNARKVQMTLDPGQSGSVRFSLDGLTWTEPEAALGLKTFSLPDVDGQHTVYVRFGDGQVYMQEFTLDRTPPVIDASWLGGATVTSNGQATIVLNASDNISRREDLKYSLDGVSWQAFQNLVTVNFTGTGYKVATIYVKDQAGNVASKLLSIYNQ